MPSKAGERTQPQGTGQVAVGHRDPLGSRLDQAPHAGPAPRR